MPKKLGGDSSVVEEDTLQYYIAGHPPEGEDGIGQNQ